MVVLAMDTATQVTAVGLGRDGELIGSAAYVVPRGHSRLLQPALASVLKMGDVQPNELDSIAVGIGPGSYTGVRLGVATAKAMATALNCTLVTVSTLAAMAYASEPAADGTPTLVIPLLYARRQRAFGAVHLKRGDVWTSRIPQQVLPVGEWVQKVVEMKQTDPTLRVTVIHDFIPKYEVLQELDALVDARCLRLADIAGGLGGALLCLANRADAQVVRDLEVHEVIPDYALQVEAEAKLAERSPLEHGHG